LFQCLLDGLPPLALEQACRSSDLLETSVSLTPQRPDEHPNPFDEQGPVLHRF
jgi:hypothetical protein